MDKELKSALGIIFLLTFLIACTSPEEKADDYIENAHSLFSEGKLVKAEIEYKNALQINQNLPDAWFGLARIHERKQKWRETYAVLTKIRELSPRHVDARIMLGQILLASNQIDHALTDAIEIIEMAPDDARSHSLMAAVQFRLDNFRGAQEEVDKALAIEPGNNEAILVRARVLIAEKKHVEALRVLDKAIEKFPDNVAMYLMKIQAHLESNNQEAIEAVYLVLVDRFPDNIIFKTQLARLYIGSKNIDKAERVLEQIVIADPTSVDGKLRLVEFKYQYRSPDEAIALLKSYVQADKNEYRYRFPLGDLFVNNGNTDQAMRVYESIIADDGVQPNGLEARNKIALLELRTGKPDKAVKLVNEVLAHDKNNENGLLLLAGMQLAEKNYDDVVLSTRTVLRDNPDSIKALGLLAQAYDANGSGELAVEAYTKAFQLRPGTAIITNQFVKSLLRKQNYQLADEFLLESMAHGNRSVETIRLLAQVKLSLREWDKAEQLARQLQKIEGQEAVSQQVLGIVYQGREEQNSSIEAFKRAHQLAPSSAQPIVALVRTYVRSGQVESARQFLNSVLSVHSDNMTAHLLLAQLSLMEKKVPAAIEHYTKVIDINPNLAIGYRGLASIYVRENDFQKAEQVINQGLSVMPDLPVLAINLASIYERQRKFDDAIAIYESLLDRNEKLKVVKNNLASLLTDYRDDQASWDRARALSSDLKSSKIPQFRDTYAWAAVKSGIHLEEAVVILEGIVRENDTVDVFNFHLGEAYRKKGDKENAIAYLNKAIKSSRPGSDIATMAKQSLQLVD